jgi:hypothetical protein
MCRCIYDSCGADSECASGVCGCNPVDVGNACVAGTCRSDTDCGVGGFCSPVITGCNGQISGYQCRSPKDTCVVDADCASGQVCASFDLGKPWTCQGPIFCG